MGDRLLVMFTDIYPFDAGEEFIEQEIDLVCEKFDRVLIIPVRIRCDAGVQTRQLPANAVAFAPRPTRIHNWKLATLLRLPQVLWYAPSLLQNCPFTQPRRALADARFGANVMDLFSKIPGIISKRALSRFDSVVFYGYWLHTPAALGALVRENMLENPTRGVVVGRAHAYDVDEKDARSGYIPARKFLLKHLDRIYPISNYAASFLEKHSPRSPQQLQVRRLGVPPAAPVKRKRDGVLRIISCSHMAPYKRIDLMMDAMARLEARGVKLEWTHVGESNLERLTRMRERAEKMFNTSKAEMTGYLPNQAALEKYGQEQMTVFLNTSDSEGVPVSVMEAMAASLPVVATAAGGTGEIVHDRENGRLIPVTADADEIADALQWIHELDDQRYRSLCEQARQTWEEMACGPRQYAEMAEHLYELSTRGV